VGLIARVIEVGGISTIMISQVKEMAERVKAPRTLFVNAPYQPGGPCWAPAGDTDRQRKMILEGLRVLMTTEGPGAIVDFSPSSRKSSPLTPAIQGE